MSLVEILIALVVLALGILAVSQLFPAATRSQTKSRMLTAASYYAQQRLESLSGTAWTDTGLSVGRHPPGTATEAVGTTGAWKRFYTVDTLSAPLDNLKRVVVTVQWTLAGTRTVRDTLYLRQ